ncbi:MAG: hypothetical protein H5T84_04175, partial [Thermoleophilia bacterium]|nr:hypothetical protein [Thermoleophilia bacterium]
GRGGGFGRPGVAYALQRRRAAPMAERMEARALAAPMAPMAKAANGMALEQADRAAAGAPEGGETPLVEPTVRKEFADTALWVGALTTREDGTAEVTLKMPQNLTTWRVKVWAMGHGTRVGEAATDVITRKNLIIRLQAPRFFVQTDEVVLSANVHNYLKSEKTAQVKLELEGNTLQPLDELVR